MSIQDLKNKLDRYSKAGDLSFKNMGQACYGFSAVAGFVPFDDTLTLGSAEVVQVNENKLSIEKDEVTWGVVAKVGIAVTFESKDKDIAASLTMTLPKTFGLDIPKVDWLPLDTLVYNLHSIPRKLVHFPLGLPAAGSITANIKAGSHIIPVTIGLKSSDTWYLEGDFESIDFPGIGDLLSLLGNSKDVNLPDSLNQLTKIAIYDITLAFNPATGKVLSVGIEIGSSPKNAVPWNIIPGVFAINSYRIGVTIANPLGATTRGIGGFIAAVLHFGDTGGFDVDISASHPPSGSWEFKGETGKDQVIHIGALVGDLAAKFRVPLPEVLQSFTLKNAGLDFNTGTGKDFKFDCQCTCDFEVANTAVEISIALGFTKKGAASPTHKGTGHSDPEGISKQEQNGGYNKSVKGSLKIGTALFKTEFSEEKDKIFSANWSDEKNPLELKDIAQTFGAADLANLLEDVPPDLDLDLVSASFTYDFTKSELILAASSKNYGSAVFAGAKIGGKWVFVFVLSLTNKKIDMALLPLVGKELAKIGETGVDKLKLLICSAVLPQTDVQSLNKLIQSAGKEYPTLPDTKEGLSKSVSLAMDLKIGGQGFTVEVGTAAKSEAAAVNSGSTGVVPAPAAAGQSPAVGSTYWITLQKSIGPVNIAGIGIRYADGALSLVFNIALLASALTIELDGLGIGLKLADISRDKISPVFDLDGISITFVSGPVEISGGFLHTVVKGIDEYNGEALIKAGDFNLSALGSYADAGQPSLFIFALINDPPLGGTPYFFLTGLAAGFGYNRGLKIPSIDGVSQFPLTSGFVPGQTSPFSGSDPGKALQVLVDKDVVPISPGENWLAAGIKFTSFEMIQSFALLVVEFGTKLEIALLGMSALSVPPEDPYPLVFAELALDVRFIPADGILAVDAQLTPDSYLLSKSCKLTGGFAFYLWFPPNDHAGDFVVTLGGYNPNFTPPDYYPRVPLLGFNWSVTPQLDIKGGMYFALTPSCLMAGGGLQATWHSGGLKAWFDMGADFLIAWKPYHYQADMYLSFGVSYTFKLKLLFATITKTISVSLGADLNIWGPDFSGIAHIHLWIISFSISFGAGASRKLPPISWEEFKDSFLPQAKSKSADAGRNSDFALPEREAGTPVTTTDSICGIKVSTGLLKALAKGPANPENIDWIVKRRGTALITHTLIPATQLIITIKGESGNPIIIDGKKPTGKQFVITNFDDLSGWLANPDVGIGPVGIKNGDLTSNHDIELLYDDGEVNEDILFTVTAVLADVPKAAWHKGKITYDKHSVIKNALVGFKIEAVSTRSGKTCPVEKKNLAYNSQDYKPAVSWSQPDAVPGPAPPAHPMQQMQDTINSTSVGGVRKSILQSLVKNGFAVDTGVDVADIASEGNNYLSAPPIFSYTYRKH